MAEPVDFDFANIDLSPYREIYVSDGTGGWAIQASLHEGSGIVTIIGNLPNEATADAVLRALADAYAQKLLNQPQSRVGKD